jgi:hypothetical protein
MQIKILFLLPIATFAADCLVGRDLLEGIRSIIARDPSVPRDQIAAKPFVGSFSTIKYEDDPNLTTTAYCLTDNACGRWEAYSTPDVPLEELACNVFCFIDAHTGNYVQSSAHNIINPPPNYLSCGWETC